MNKLYIRDKLLPPPAATPKNSNNNKNTSLLLQEKLLLTKKPAPALSLAKGSLHKSQNRPMWFHCTDRVEQGKQNNLSL